MTWASNLTGRSIKSEVLLKMTLKIRLAQTATNDSGSIYWFPFDYGHVVEMDPVSGTTRTTEVATKAQLLNTSQFYVNRAEGRVYIFNGADPGAVTWDYKFEVFLSTKPCLWHRNPTDTSSAIVDWDGSLERAPEVSKSIADLKYGMPQVFASGFSVVYNQSWQKIISSASFKNKEVSVYHVAGDLSADNCQLLFTGIIGDRYSTDLRRINFELINKFTDFDQPINNTMITNTLQTTEDIEPGVVGRIIRTVLGQYGIHFPEEGYVGGLRPVCTDYNGTMNTSNNRQWTVGHERTQRAILSHTANLTHVSNTVKQFANATDRQSFDMVGEYVHVQNGGTAFGAKITDVDSGTNRITFQSSVNAGDVTITRYWSGRVYLVQDGTRYRLLPGRDYTFTRTTSPASDGYWINIHLVNNFEANVGSTTLNLNNGDHIFLIVDTPMYQVPTIGGSPINSGVAMQNAYELVYHYLTEVMGLSESEIDTATFDTGAGAGATHMNGANFNLPGSVFPFFGDESKPTNKEALTKILRDNQMILFYNHAGLLTVKEYGVGSSVITFDLDEAEDGSIQFEFDNDRLRNIGARTDVGDSACISSGRSVGLSLVTTQFEVVSNYSILTEPDPVNDGGRHDLYGEPIYLGADEPFTETNGRLQVTLRGDLSLMDLELGDIVTLRSTFLPGYDYDGETQHEQEFVLVEQRFSSEAVVVVLEELDR